MPTNSSLSPGPTRSGTVSSRNASSSARVKPMGGRVSAGGETEDMPRPYWPLFDLVVRTPRLTVRYLDDALAVELATLAARASTTRTRCRSPIRGRTCRRPSSSATRSASTGGRRAETAPESWNLLFAVFEGDDVVGSTSLGANRFPVVRTFETGSWLGRRYQGRGLGYGDADRDTPSRLSRSRRARSENRRVRGQPGVARRDPQARL